MPFPHFARDLRRSAGAGPIDYGVPAFPNLAPACAGSDGYAVDGAHRGHSGEVNACGSGGPGEPGTFLPVWWILIFRFL